PGTPRRADREPSGWARAAQRVRLTEQLAIALKSRARVGEARSHEHGPLAVAASKCLALLLLKLADALLARRGVDLRG
ncbi:MAG: hypothetical protein H0U12_07465, partial [Thermoleophilaceae bacterium]|nr:hypothetical protein [Thermoleophilaceae bacterium]